MRRLFVVCFLFGVPLLLLAQAPAKSSFMDAGVIQHEGTTGTLTANFPRPLVQAIETISQEYGWIVDFEDPLYRSHFDLVDATDPAWRAIHPNDKGATRVAGGLFQSSFPEPSTITDNAEEQTLQRLVSDYNSSGNPGKFIVRKEAEGRYAVIGVSRRDETGKDEAVNALLDTSVSMPMQQRDATATLQLIADTLTANTGVKVHLGTFGLSSDPLEECGGCYRRLKCSRESTPFAGVRQRKQDKSTLPANPRMELPLRRRYQCLLVAFPYGDKKRNRRQRKADRSIYRPTAKLTTESDQRSTGQGSLRNQAPFFEFGT